MINIIISPSQQKWNACAIDNCTEQEHCFAIGNKIFELLNDYDCNKLLIQPIFGTEQETLNKVVKQSNAFVKNNPADASFHLDIHTDAGYAGHGASGFYMSERGKSFIIQVWREISKITPWGDGNVSRRDLKVLRDTTATAGLIEVSFHDIPEEAKWIHLNIDAIAAAIVRGIVATTGIVKFEKPVHWAEKFYKGLLDLGMVINERRFKDPVNRGECFALLLQLAQILLRAVTRRNIT